MSPWVGAPGETEFNAKVSFLGRRRQLRFFPLRPSFRILRITIFSRITGFAIFVRITRSARNIRFTKSWMPLFWDLPAKTDELDLDSRLKGFKSLGQLPAQPQVGKADVFDVLPDKMASGVDTEESRAARVAPVMC